MAASMSRGRQRPGSERGLSPELLLSVAKLTTPAGAFLDLHRERQAVLDRGVRPLSAGGWRLEEPVIKLWMGSRSIGHIIEGTDERSAQVMFRIIEAVESLYPGRAYEAQPVAHDTSARQ
eukprot:SAG22_NODE_12674_length_433_cov_1.227545_1_plen_119_part_10